MILLLIKLLGVSSYKLLDNVTPVFPKVLKPCQGISKRLLSTSIEVCKQLQDSGYDVSIGKNNATGSVCSEAHNSHYGYMMPYENFTEIHISNKLLDKPTTLYNVLLHEVLHSVGLDHSTSEGLMKYSITQTFWGSVENDQRRLWLSIDDLSGLYYLKHYSS